jgi:hypothetical protein
VYTACTRVQTVPLDPYSCTCEMTPSIQVYTPDKSTRTAVQPASLQTYSCAAGAMCAARLCTASQRLIRDAQQYLRTYDLAGSGLTFEIMRFGSNTGRDFNDHLPEAQSNPQTSSSRWTTLCRDKNLNRPRGSPLKLFAARLSQVIRLAH